jgi:hypothetical protein
MIRRHNGVVQDAASSPTKDDLRRRLFDDENGDDGDDRSPQKSTKSKRKGDASGGALQLSTTSILAFVCFGVLLLLGVHGYLLQTLLLSQSESSAETSVQVVPTAPLRRRRASPLPKRALQPLQEKDWNQYTIRINTWRRPDQLLVSVDWHSNCEGVAQIQIVWCDPEHEPPPELATYENVVIERHEVNTLNERFHILTPPPTLGILSIDDDVLRPCEAIDAGFFRWTESPDRMVGFDGRLHVENDDGSWKVSSSCSPSGRLSTCSLTLTYPFFLLITVRLYEYD